MKAIKALQILFLWIAFIPMYAQEAKCGIFGVVTDRNGVPMENVTLLLLQAKDSAYVVGGITDSKGQFSISKLSARDYCLELSMLGYQKQFISVRLIGSADKNLGTLIMKEDMQLLSGVTVTEKRTLMKIDPGTTTFHMESMIIGSQGNVLDTLRTLPGVIMNEDGDVILNGQSGISVLVNGKSTYMSSDQLVNYLRSMPVSSIKDIKLITSPSAKYDAAGKTGLIDIRTKKVTMEGWTANVNTGYQQSQDGKWNAGGRFTWQKDQIGVFMDYSHSQGKYKSVLGISRVSRMQNKIEGSEMEVNQESQMKDHNRGDWVRVGFDYDINEKFTFGISTIGNLFTKQLPGYTDACFNRTGSSIDSILQTRNISKLKQHSFSGGTYLSYKDDKKREADLSFDYLLHSHKETIGMHNEMEDLGAHILSCDTMKGNLNGNIYMYSAQTNTTIPLSSQTILHVGGKCTWVDLDNSAFYQKYRLNNWQMNYDLSNSYNYKENINAAYVQINTQMGAFSLEGGLRLEQTHVYGTHYPSDIALSDSSYTDNYLHLFPTLTVQYHFPETENSLSLLYNRRIIRPNYRDLSPFNYIWDEYTRSTGNPDLQAELTDNIELAYIHKGVYRTALFFSYTKDPIMQSIGISEDNVVITYPDNFKNNLRMGMRLEAGDILHLKWWRMTANAAFLYSLYRWEEFGETVEKILLTPSAGINNQFTLSAGWNAELSGFYNGRMAVGQGTVRPHYSVSMAVQKKFWNNKLILRFYANDIFQSNRQDLVLDLAANKGHVSTRQFNDYRCFGVSVSLNLKQGASSKKNSRDITIDQSKRITL